MEPAKRHPTFNASTPDAPAPAQDLDAGLRRAPTPPATSSWGSWSVCCCARTPSGYGDYQGEPSPLLLDPPSPLVRRDVQDLGAQEPTGSSDMPWLDDSEEIAMPGPDTGARASPDSKSAPSAKACFLPSDT